jgi:hypothetical protein
MIKCIKLSNKKEWRNSKAQIHRVKGPAIEYNDGTKVWYKNGLCHRLDGPAVECNDGYKVWYQNGKPHRIDGPAKEFIDGTKSWWIEGKRYSEEEFNEKVESLHNQIKVAVIFIKI